MSSTIDNLKFKKGEIWSIPNLMGYIRILLIPVFCWFFLTAETAGDYYRAGVVVIISTLTDFLDGFIARRFHMITELGKFIDPVADKMTHGALAGCLASKFPLLWLVFGAMVLKEGFMLLMGWLKLKKGKKLDGAMWYGKVCTALLFTVMCMLLFWVNIPVALADGLILLCLAFMIFTWIMYAWAFKRME